MRRGTTPVFKMEVTGIDWSELKTMNIMFKQGDVELVKTDEDIHRDDDTNILVVQLSQEDTFMFKENKSIKVQARFLMNNGQATATKVAIIYISEILQEEVLT